MKDKLFVFIVGPTASGKTDLTMNLARKYAAPVVNADSVQAYKHVDIGSAKPTSEEIKGVRTFLFDFVEYPAQLTSAEMFRKTNEVVKANPSDSVFFVSGGSGFYLQSLENGLSAWPAANPNLQESIRKQILEIGDQAVWQKLNSLAPRLAAKISPHDHYRLVRYLEVAESLGGESFTALENAQGGLASQGRILKIGISWNKEDLRLRIAGRLDEMLRLGWIKEVRSLMKSGKSDWWPMKSVGYHEIVQYLSAAAAAPEPATAELKEKILQENMKLVKKQLTWFKRDTSIHWIEGQLSPEEIFMQASALIEQAMKS